MKKLHIALSVAIVVSLFIPHVSHASILSIDQGGTGTDSFDNGSVVFYANGLFQQNSAFFYDYLENTLSIGTNATSTISKLTVKGDGSQNILNILSSTGDPKIFIPANGHVGIGNDSPEVALDISGAFYSRLVSASSATIDWSEGNVQDTTLAGNTTFTFQNAHAGGEYSLIVNQDATGNRSVTWPSQVRWPGGVAPTLSTTSEATDLVRFIYDGTRYLGYYYTDYAAPAPSTAIAYWKFDESSGNASDATGNGFTLTNNNSISYSSGLINNTSDFGSSNSIQYFSNSAHLGTTFDRPFTYNFWMKVTTQPSSGSAAVPLIWVDDTTANKKGLAEVQLYNNGGTMEVYIDRHDDDGTDQIGTAHTFTTGTWHMLTYTWDGSTQKLYVDGNSTPLLSQASSRTGTNTGTNYGDYFAIGGDTYNSRYFSGKIDEVGIWDRALSTTEISSIYNSGSGDQYPF